MGKLSFLEQRKNALLFSPPRSDGRLFLKTEEGKSTCSLDGSGKLERKLSHCERQEKRTPCSCKLGLRFLFFFFLFVCLFSPQTSQTAIEINIGGHPKEAKHNEGWRGGDGEETTLSRAGHESTELLTGDNPQRVQPLRAPGISRWKGQGENATRSHPPTVAHTDTYRLSRFKTNNNNKKTPEIHLQNNKGNTKYRMHFRGFPSWETIPNGDGGGVGDKKYSSVPGVGLQSPLTSFMVVLFCSQRHSITLILLQGEEGSGGKEKVGGGGGGRSTCTRAGQVGRRVRSPPLGPGPSGHPQHPRPSRPRPGAAAARGDPTPGPAPALPGPSARSLVPRQPPRLGQIKQLPLRPSARA